MNHREVLGIDANASKTEIKKAFRNAAKEVHPDHSKSPEAAEAFARIKKAHDALILEAETPRESATVRSSAAHAAAATAQSTYSTPTPTQQMTDEELKHIQDLDTKARQKTKAHGLFNKAKDSVELRRHRKKLKTNEKRMSGLY